MPNKVKITSFFEARYKRLTKKFNTLEAEVDELVEQLLENPALGASLGAGLYKIRLASKSKGGGKSGGFRIITYLISEREDGIDIHLITMFDKSEESSIQKDTLVKIVKQLFG
ncbi:MAG: type II toxin-antitoxin system RelE/ParE family toxin [Bacteroidetes bacterium]|nr:type II toxin-antitoxin system RelE/ParE family toxin [Bacteroidota bacterium]